MSSFTDQEGKPITLDEFLTQVSEAILANLMVFDALGIPRNQVKQIVGRDGGTLIGGGMTLQTPIGRPLSHEAGRKLFDTYAALLEHYDASLLPEDRLARIRERNNFERKVAAHRESKARDN